MKINSKEAIFILATTDSHFGVSENNQSGQTQLERILSMFKNAGSYLQFYCDGEAQVLRIASTAPLLPGFRESWRLVAQFKSREEWINSSYYAQITNEDARESIEWFWEELHDKAQVS